MVAEVAGQTKVPTAGKAPPQELGCIDSVKATVVIDASLDSDFLRSKQASYPWYIVKHDDGHLEDTMNGGHPSRKAVRKIEHTSNCVSNHQGEHVMNSCDATLMSGGGVELSIYGGLPAYTSGVTVKIDEKKQFTCDFEFISVAPFAGTIQWNITRKTLRLKKDGFKAGERLFGWLSVEFEGILTANGKETRQSYKIEGYIKPVIQTAAAAAQGR
ncbi:hypothetical protein [Prosthecobacter sp.]|uniref:hypothetical protein n=1 Tax=Prosthecobacter sp. TaxID=1965333 RepID=UPI0037833065